MIQKSEVSFPIPLNTFLVTLQDLKINSIWYEHLIWKFIKKKCAIYCVKIKLNVSN